jgi:hypothetical protein
LGLFAICFHALLLFGTACTPAKIVRMGPKIPPRPADCDIEVLKKGVEPSRPYRDVGLVELEHCEDYLRLPCRKWLIQAGCKLGGQVAYLPEEGGPVLDTATVVRSQSAHIVDGPVTYRIIIAAYVADLDYDLDTDPVVNSRRCKPTCKENETCVNGRCKRSADCKVEKGKANNKDPDDFESGRCPE